MIGHADLLKRAVSASAERAFGEGQVLDTLPILVMLCNFLVFFMVWLLLAYTIGLVFPVLAMVEDESPPAYEPIALADDNGDFEASWSAEQQQRQAAANEDPNKRLEPSITSTAHCVGSSLRGLFRMLRANGGVETSRTFGTYFKGFGCYMTMQLITGLFMSPFTEGMSPIFGVCVNLIITLALTPLDVAWVHIIISRNSSLPFWRRLAPYGRVLEATWRPALLMWAVSKASLGVIMLATWLLNVNGIIAEPEMLNANSSSKWKLLVILIIICFARLATLPTSIILFRVHASLLAPEVDTIVPFDRSFGGRAEPALVGGRGYATICDVWSSFSKTAWRRIAVLYTKIYILAFVIVSVGWAILFAQFLLFAAVYSDGSS